MEITIISLCGIYACDTASRILHTSDRLHIFLLPCDSGFLLVIRLELNTSALLRSVLPLTPNQYIFYFKLFKNHHNLPFHMPLCSGDWELVTFTQFFPPRRARCPALSLTQLLTFGVLRNPSLFCRKLWIDGKNDTPMRHLGFLLNVVRTSRF